MSTINDMGIDDEHIGIYHPKHKNRWKATFYGITTGRTIDATNISGTSGVAAPVAGQSVPQADRGLTMQVVTMQRPNLSFNEIELHRYNSIAYVQAKHSWAELSLSLEDDVTGWATAALQTQLERQQYLIGTMGGGSGSNHTLLAPGAVGREYKFACDLTMLDGGKQALEVWHLQGCWLKSVNWGDVDYSSGDAVKIDVSMRFDHAWQEVIANEYGTALGGF